MEQFTLKNLIKNGKTENRQCRANPVDVAWLAGVLDGEGCIYAGWASNHKPNLHKYEHIRASIGIANIHLGLMQKVQRVIFEITYKKFRIASYNRSRNSLSDNAIYQIVATDQASIKALCLHLLPYLTVKKEQAEIMLNFVLSREEHRHNGLGYTDLEKGVVEQLSLLKRCPNPGGVETKHEAPQGAALC